MVPGLTDTDCRVAELRARELRVNAERQRLAAQVHPARSERAGHISRQVSALAGGMLRRLHGVRSPESAGAARTAAMGLGQ